MVIQISSDIRIWIWPLFFITLNIWMECTAFALVIWVQQRSIFPSALPNHLLNSNIKFPAWELHIKKAEKCPFGIRRRGRWCQHWRGRLKGIRERWRKMARWRKRKSFQPSVQSMSFLTVVHQKSAMEKARRFHLQCSFAYLHSYAYWLGLIHKWLHVRFWSVRKNARMQMLRITETDRNLVIRSSNNFFSSVLCECASTSIVSVNTFPHRLIDFVTTPVLMVSLRWGWGSPLFLAFLRF